MTVSAEMTPISPYCPGEIDNTWNDPARRAPLVVGDSASFHAVTERICYVAEAPRPPKAWYIAFTVAFTFSLKARPKLALGADTVSPYHLVGE